ncbi:hypothetical protein KUTeg_013051 [Tegillarca granosa]|uniref:Uncharacterized protein n=1 Tax=Tegillarca granosa TaxID=220873 RepID=A0ABQ9EW19_TEGGR|nr:hypothetical protein KUTeg_013051 [Tegillarca granosa]
MIFINVIFTFRQAKVKLVVIFSKILVIIFKRFSPLFTLFIKYNYDISIFIWKSIIILYKQLQRILEH